MAAKFYSTAPAHVNLPSTVFECPDGFYIIKSNEHTQPHAEEQTILLSSTGIIPFERDIYTWIIVENDTGPQLFAKRIFTPLEIFTKHLQLAEDLKHSLKKVPDVIYAGEMKAMVHEDHVYKAADASTQRLELPMATRLVVNLASGSFAPPVNPENIEAVRSVFQHVFPKKTIEVTSSLDTFIPEITCDELMKMGRKGTINLFRFKTRKEAENYKSGAITLLKEELRENMMTQRGFPYEESLEIKELKQLMATPKLTIEEMRGGTKRKRKRKRTLRINMPNNKIK